MTCLAFLVAGRRESSIAIRSLQQKALHEPLACTCSTSGSGIHHRRRCFQAVERALTLCVRVVKSEPDPACAARSVGLRVLMLRSGVGRFACSCGEGSSGSVRSVVGDSDNMVAVLTSACCASIAAGPRLSLPPVATSSLLHTSSHGPFSGDSAQVLRNLSSPCGRQRTSQPRSG